MRVLAKGVTKLTNMNSVHIAQATEYNRFNGTNDHSAGHSGITSTTFGVAKHAIHGNGVIDDYDGEENDDDINIREAAIDLCNEIDDSQTQGQSKWRIYKKPKLRKKTNNSGSPVKQDDNANSTNGNR